MIAFAEAGADKKRKGSEPPFPFELEYVWNHFRRLAARRQIGMAANPLTYLELEAYERKTLVHLPAWEADLIMRLDDAVRLAADPGKPASSPSAQEPTEIPASDVKSVKGFFRGLGAKIKAK